MIEVQVERSEPANWTAWAVSMLNAMWGDYLHARGNGLAVEMAFYQHGQPLTLDCHALRTAHARPTTKLCVLLHGLGCNELLWQFAPPTEEKKALYTAVDYGRLLYDDLGYTPFYVRYNTGLAIAENGRSLARLLDTLYNCYSIPIGEIVLIGHSMGGLVVRSACHYATQHSEPWVKKVKHIHYLGTPHDGADLERLTHRTAKTLQAIPNPITRLISDGLNLRSRGIKDLRHGTLLEPDVMDEGWDDLAHHHRRTVPWLPHAQHYLVGGTWHGDPEHVVSVLLGDGLVGAPATMDGTIPVQNIRLFPGIRHLQLARNWEVYQQIVTWLQAKEEE